MKLSSTNVLRFNKEKTRSTVELYANIICFGACTNLWLIRAKVVWTSIDYMDIRARDGYQYGMLEHLEEEVGSRQRDTASASVHYDHASGFVVS